ncbi:MAG: methyltransferase domain-containing protein [Candidatus Aenigmarchaeota archaeon]|nr:methyltransferase domain-containing protein [Candidatus Aenigmarchaeota archaeon]
MVGEKNIADYYDNCEIDYRLIWDLKRSMSIHYGYWDKGTRNLHDALLNTNRIMARRIGISRRDHVLDAGCGVGGSSIFLARNYGCTVEGITLSRRQVRKARLNAERHGVGGSVSFHVGNFMDTGFPDGSFDAIWAIESVCHADRKADFMKEAYRVLKEGGRIVIADGFKAEGIEPEEEKLLEKMIRGWSVPNLSTVNAFCRSMRKVGFRNVKMTDETLHILPSSRRLYYASFPGLLITKLGEVARIRNRIQTANVMAAYYQYKALRKGVWRYGLVSAEK